MEIFNIPDIIPSESFTRYLSTLSRNMVFPQQVTSLPSGLFRGSFYYPYPSEGRDKDRKSARRKRRINNISLKVFSLLLNCDVMFLNTLTPDELIRFKESVGLALNIDGEGVDYYPIPKRLHNKLRKFIHDNPLRPGHASLAAEDSIFMI